VTNSEDTNRQICWLTFPVSYEGDPDFNSQPESWLSWWRNFKILFYSSR